MKFWQKKIFYIYGHDRDYFCEWEEYFTGILWRLNFRMEYWSKILLWYCDKFLKFEYFYLFYDIIRAMHLQFNFIFLKINGKLFSKNRYNFDFFILLLLINIIVIIEWIEKVIIQRRRWKSKLAKRWQRCGLNCQSIEIFINEQRSRKPMKINVSDCFKLHRRKEFSNGLKLERWSNNVNNSFAWKL